MPGRTDYLYLRKEGRSFRSPTMPEPDGWYVHALLDDEITRGGLRPGTDDPVELVLPDGRRLFYLATGKAEGADCSASKAAHDVGEVVNAASGFTIRALLTDDRNALAADVKGRLAACSEASMRPLGRAMPPAAAGGQAVYVRVWLPDDGCIPLRASGIDNTLAARIASCLEGLERTGRLNARPGQPVRLEATGLPGTFYYACWERRDPNSEHRKYNEIRVVRVGPEPAPWLGDIALLLAGIGVPTSREEIESGGWKSVQAVEGQVQAIAVPATPRQASTRPAAGRAAGDIDADGAIEPRVPRRFSPWLLGLLALIPLAAMALIYAWSNRQQPDGGDTRPERPAQEREKSDSVPPSTAQSWGSFHRDLGEWVARAADNVQPDDLMKRLIDRFQRPDLTSAIDWGVDTNQRELYEEFRNKKPRPRNLYLDFIDRLPPKEDLPTPKPWPKGEPTTGQKLARYYPEEMNRLRVVLEKLEGQLGLPEGARTDWSRWKEPADSLAALKSYLTFYLFEDRVGTLKVYEEHKKTTASFAWQPTVKKYLKGKYVP